MSKTILITGGAGFIGINTAKYYLSNKDKVMIFDNFSRRGSRDNIEWLKQEYKTNLKIVEGDIRTDQKFLLELAKQAELVLHLAGQVAVTTSVLNPREDFEINALGTFNVLEAVRQSGNNPIFIYSSTNKVYGGMEDLEIAEEKTRYVIKNLPFGTPESRNLDFHSPYGCSKGAGDQYVRDYSRIYGLNTIVFRQSCIYGPHQFGIEDQGWLAWFMISLTLGKKITIYGTGKQVRDVLYIEDLINAYDLAAKHIQITKGQVYNIGGGIKNSLSIWHEFQPHLERLFKKKIDVKFADSRPGDQPVFISDIRKAKKDFNWEPRINPEEGIEKLFTWITSNKSLFKYV